MPTKKKSSSTAKKGTKKQTSKNSTLKKKAVKKKSPVKKTVKKKTAAKKKTATKKKSAAKKKPARKKAAKKTSSARKKSEAVEVKKTETIVLASENNSPEIHLFPESRTLLNQLPVVDLDNPHDDQTPTMPDPAPETEMPGPEQQGTYTLLRSRLAFYLGVFLGAVVVNAFLVSILVVMSA
jgi:hypothetical protein